ncbi:hypothetical protein [uncultured Microbulbifer sp.]|uniref:hypothetical protein n=1 Tax=uncultured Microbulbifer sp. TaxID=348147 RepID=UPI002621C90C|nr:hypothetical protein [uncultured Microbulbifer sp.]
MDRNNSCTAIFPSHDLAESSIKPLQNIGIDLKAISIIGKDYHTEEKVHGYYNTGDRIKFWGKNGIFWGSIWGILFGGAFLFIPGLGPVAVAGPLVQVLVGALEGVVIGGSLGALGAALVSIGIPKDSIVNYETAIKADKFILIVHGEDELLNKAKATLQEISGVESVDLHRNNASQ